MREDIFHEEQTEFFKAYSLENETLKRKEQLDAVCDMFYVAAGNLLENSKSIEQAKQKWTKGVQGRNSIKARRWKNHKT